MNARDGMAPRLEFYSCAFMFNDLRRPPALASVQAHCNTG